MNRLKSHIGEGAVLLSAVLWGCIGIFTRNMLAIGFSSVQIVAVRAFITAALMFFIILFTDRSLFKVKIRDLWMFFGTGICSFLFFNICYMSSIGENSLSVACILMYTSPIWVALLSVPLFKEELSSVKIIAFILCFGGCIAVCLSGTLKLTKIGLVLGLLSGLGYALYSIFGKYASAKYNTLTVTFYTFLFASVGALPICNPQKLGILLTDGKNMLLSLGVTLFSTLLPYLLYTYGLSLIGAGKASVIAIFEPAVAATVGALVFSESMGVSGFIGIISVMAGLVFLEIGKPIRVRGEKSGKI